jgi:hypothetical protein
MLFNTLTLTLEPLTLGISLTPKLIGGREDRGGGGGRGGRAA